MNKFIRIDRKGHWRDTEHRSRIANTGDDFDCELILEAGISCFEANVEGIESLYDYCMNYMSLEVTDYPNFQLTIFEGEKVGYGTDGEDIARCIKTLDVKELEPFIDAIYDLKDAVEYDDMEREEFEKKSLELLK